MTRIVLLRTSTTLVAGVDVLSGVSLDVRVEEAARANVPKREAAGKMPAASCTIFSFDDYRPTTIVPTTALKPPPTARQ